MLYNSFYTYEEITMKAVKHIVKRIKGDYRMIVISDIHGHYDQFVALLEKVNYDPEADYLVINGDFVEKGDQVLKTIHLVMALARYPRCYVLMGNCEWALAALLTIPELAKEIPHYLEHVAKNGVIRYFYDKEHLYDGHETMLGIQRVIAHELEQELKFIIDLPVTLKINDMIFVHAALPAQGPYKKGTLSGYLETSYFLWQGHGLKEMVIVGHLPTGNYRPYDICSDIIIDTQKRIISIDGGMGVKPIAQLNALIITSNQGEVTYQQEEVVDFPQTVINRDTQASLKEPVKIAYPDYQVTLIAEGEDFSLCEHEKTKKMVAIKNEFLSLQEGRLLCQDDYVDRFLGLKKGDQVYLIGIYHHYAYVMHDGIVGWVPRNAVDW